MDVVRSESRFDPPFDFAQEPLQGTTVLARRAAVDQQEGGEEIPITDGFQQPLEPGGVEAHVVLLLFPECVGSSWNWAIAKSLSWQNSARKLRASEA